MNFLPNTREQAIALIFALAEGDYNDLADALGFLGCSPTEVLDGWKIYRQRFSQP